MHAVTFACFLIETAWISFLLWKLRGLRIGAESVNERLDEVISDLLKHGADIASIRSELQEREKTYGEDARLLGERISGLSDAQEKIRRKAARPATSNYAWEGMRTVAETNSARGDSDHSKLVALAEGQEDV